MLNTLLISPPAVNDLFNQLFITQIIIKMQYFVLVEIMAHN
ncbi:hypothetical protein FHW89_004470 [Mucilaginibacter sp. SG564]|nr:hypothetical protein [Mucilaginibacter sp. SG564]